MPAFNSRKEIASSPYKERNCQLSIQGKKLSTINTRKGIASKQYKERNCLQSIQGKKLPVIITRQEIVSNQFKARNCQQSIQGKKLPAINTRKEIASNQYKARNCQQSIQGKKLPAVNTRQEMPFTFFLLLSFHSHGIGSVLPLEHLQSPFQKSLEVNCSSDLHLAFKKVTTVLPAFLSPKLVMKMKYSLKLLLPSKSQVFHS